jgi:hypothetical protein
MYGRLSDPYKDGKVRQSNDPLSSVTFEGIRDRVKGLTCTISTYNHLLTPLYHPHSHSLILPKRVIQITSISCTSALTLEVEYRISGSSG